MEGAAPAEEVDAAVGIQAAGLTGVKGRVGAPLWTAAKNGAAELIEKGVATAAARLTLDCDCRTISMRSDQARCLRP